MSFIQYTASLLRKCILYIPVIPICTSFIIGIVIADTHSIQIYFPVTVVIINILLGIALRGRLQKILVICFVAFCLGMLRMEKVKGQYVQLDIASLSEDGYSVLTGYVDDVRYKKGGTQVVLYDISDLEDEFSYSGKIQRSRKTR